MPRTEEQFEEIREQKRALIMSTSMELFAEEGYHNVSISKIADKAGISKGLMYNYFKSKEALIISIIDEGIEELFDLFDPNHDGHITDEEFVNFVRKSSRLVQENTRFWKLYFALFTQPKVYHLVEEKTQKVFSEMIELLSSFFSRRGIEDPETEAVLFGAMLDGIAYNYVMNPGLFPLENITEKIITRYIRNQKK